MTLSQLLADKATAAFAEDPGSAPEEQPSADTAPAASEPEAPQTAPPTAEPDFKSLYEKAEKERIPTLMSERDTAVRERDEAKALVAEAGGEWENWLELGATRGYSAKQLLDHIRSERQAGEQQQVTTKAAKADSVTQINALYRRGETAFASYLEDIVETTGARLNPESIERHRATFTRLTGNTPTTDPVAPATTASAATPVATAPRTPPPVPTPSGPIAEPVWSPKADTRSLLRRGLAKAIGG